MPYVDAQLMTAPITFLFMRKTKPLVLCNDKSKLSLGPTTTDIVTYVYGPEKKNKAVNFIYSSRPPSTNSNVHQASNIIFLCLNFMLFYITLHTFNQDFCYYSSTHLSYIILSFLISLF